ncbi:hypothetical protein ACFVT5_13505 [Streptomyces sp. NPDC058001]|uniref:hypothetical protein n=1 Tax=Streptomyces sp. NPDC058001 TaxID=3346300 RepID=UPI0036F1654A
MARVKRDTLADHFEACGERRINGSVITVYVQTWRLLRPRFTGALLGLTMAGCPV